MIPSLSHPTFFHPRYNFLEMWDFVKLAPDKLLAISKTLTGASFGFGLSKVLASFGFALTSTIPVRQPQPSICITPTISPNNHTYARCL